MVIDIDRLHNVVAGKMSGRGAGITFSQIHEISGILEVRDDIKTIIVILPWIDRVRFIMNMMKNVLDTHGLIIYNTRQNLIKVGNDKIILFLSVHNARERLVGLEDCYIVYMDCTDNDVLKGGMNVKRDYGGHEGINWAHCVSSLTHCDSFWR